MPMRENTMPTTYKHFRVRSEGNEKMPLTFARKLKNNFHCGVADSDTRIKIFALYIMDAKKSRSDILSPRIL